MEDLANAYKTAMAKIYLDWGETFTPVYKAYYDYVSSTTVKNPSKCDEDCFFSKCFSKPHGITYSCLDKCGCEIDKKAHEQAIADLKKAY